MPPLTCPRDGAPASERASHVIETRDTVQAVKSFLQHATGNANFTGE
jgi:hypothetical protein